MKIGEIWKHVKNYQTVKITGFSEELIREGKESAIDIKTGINEKEFKKTDCVHYEVIESSEHGSEKGFKGYLSFSMFLQFYEKVYNESQRNMEIKK